MTFELVHTDKKTGARAGILHTAHGSIETPFFMPVATRGTVKTLAPHEIPGDVIIANAFHLSMKPGVDVIKAHGGLHGFMGWQGGIFTDSGGFQIIRENFFRKITPDGLLYNSPVSGKKEMLTPESIVEIQEALGSDVAMVLDDCPPHPSNDRRIRESVKRTIAWAERCLKHRNKIGGKALLFAIVQGGLDREMRKHCAGELVSMGFDGFAIGGLSIGESKEEMNDIVRFTTPLLPEDRPRYLMGVGSPAELLVSISSGIDVFDSVFPTRNGRHGTIYTNSGSYNIARTSNLNENGPLEEGCECYACRNYTRAYVSHLMREKEMFGLRLASIHNLWFIRNLMKRAREAIMEDRFEEFTAEFIEGYEKR